MPHPIIMIQRGSCFRISSLYKDLNLERASRRAIYHHVIWDRSRGTPTHSPRHMLLVIESSWQCLGYYTPGPRPFLYPFLLLLVCTHGTLNKYTCVSTARTAANDRIDAGATILLFFHSAHVRNIFFKQNFLNNSSLYTTPFPFIRPWNIDIV